jgi:hypothetical protein
MAVQSDSSRFYGAALQVAFGSKFADCTMIKQTECEKEMNSGE